MAGSFTKRRTRRARPEVITGAQSRMATARPLEQLLTEWKQAEECARDAEVELYRAYLDFASVRGPPPSEEQRRTVISFRTEASARYDALMATLDEVMARLDALIDRW